MSGSIRLGLMLLATVFAVYFAYKLIAAMLSLLIPALVVIGVAGILYAVVSRKALGGGRRLLP